MSQSNNIFKILAVSIFISFSAFCYCYINYFAPHQDPTTELLLQTSTTELEQDDQDVFFPDVQLFTKIVKGVERVLEVL